LDNCNEISGLHQIVEDNIADVVNISFVRAEADYLAAKNVSLTHVHDIEDQLFQQGTAQGITFVASNADHGAIPLVRGKPTVSARYPESDP
jgi:subtilase family serine protease